jgi:hypothetical protein
MRPHARLAFAAAAVLLALVGCLPSAQASWNVGGGTVRGRIDFGTGPACPGTPFRITGTATGLVFNTVIQGDLGDIALTGTGCEGTSGTTATVSMEAHGVGPTGSRIDCYDLDGSYTRNAAVVDLSVTGPCVINNFNTGSMTYRAVVGLAPTGDFAGVITVVIDTSRPLIHT